jgi:acyl-CoA thioesterase I
MKAFLVTMRSTAYGLLRGRQAAPACGAAILALGPGPFRRRIRRDGEPLRLVALGDSLTQGYGLPQDEGLVPQLEAWLQDEGA